MKNTPWSILIVTLFRQLKRLAWTIKFPFEWSGWRIGMHLTYNIQIFTSKCANDNRLIDRTNGCICKNIIRKERSESEKFQLQFHLRSFPIWMMPEVFLLPSSFSLPIFFLNVFCIFDLKEKMCIIDIKTDSGKLLRKEKKFFLSSLENFCVTQKSFWKAHFPVQCT